MADKISNIKERILQVADYLHIPRSKFCGIIGSTYGNFTGKSKLTPINSDVLGVLLSKYPDISVRWLITGEGEILENTSRELNQTITGNHNQLTGRDNITSAQLMDQLNELKLQISSKDKIINDLLNQQSLLLNQINKITDRL